MHSRLTTGPLQNMHLELIFSPLTEYQRVCFSAFPQTEDQSLILLGVRYQSHSLSDREHGEMFLRKLEKENAVLLNALILGDSVLDMSGYNVAQCVQESLFCVIL